jgi:acyl carrier protein
MQEKFITSFKEALELIDEFEVNLDDEFRTYEAWDSLSQLSLIAMLDDEYGIQIEQDEFAKMRTVGDLLSKVS